MAETYRGQCNLHLHFAKQYLSEPDRAGADRWGGHFQRACLESALWQLRLAYECHLADMIFQQPLYSQALPAGRLSAQYLAKSSHPPEIAELADREIHDEQLKWLLDYRFVRQPSAAKEYNPSLLNAVSADGDDDREWAQSCLEFLRETIARHRSTLQEY